MVMVNAAPRRLRANCAAVLVTGLLAGCSLFAPPGSQDSRTAQALIQKIPGVASVDVNTTTPLNSQAGSSTDIFVTIKSDYSVGDSVIVLDWALKTAWSVNDDDVKQGVFLVVNSSTPTTIVKWDWSGAAKKLGFSDPGAGYGTPTPIFPLFFSKDEMVKRYGPWPGQVPKTPANLFVKTG